MQNEIITASNVLPPGVEVSFGTLTAPHELTQINVTALPTDTNAAGTLWRLYSITPAGEALISETALQDPRLVSRRIVANVKDGGLVELRGFNPGAVATLAIDASLVGSDPGCCVGEAGPPGPEGPPGPDGPVGPAAAFQTDDFTPTLGQTAFVLSTAPTDIPNMRVSVNGVLYQQGTDYTVVGTALTWLDTPFALETTDWLEVYYAV